MKFITILALATAALAAPTDDWNNWNKAVTTTVYVTVKQPEYKVSCRRLYHRNTFADYWIDRIQRQVYYEGGREIW